MNDRSAISAALARHIHAVRYNDLPTEAVEATKRSIIDAIGVMHAASGLGEGCEAFATLASAFGGVGTSTVIGWGFQTSPIFAAFANGAMAHALDFEDTHDATLVHPHAAVVPAALAVAEMAGGVTGRDFLTAVATGADLSCRLALGLTESVEKRGFYFIPMLSAYGAAAAAAKLLKLSERQIVQSLALASCQAVFSDALVSHPPSHLRAIRDGFSAKAGVTAALLAQRGIEAFDEPIEGRGGLYANFASGKFDGPRLLDKLGSVFEGANVSIKPWPSCRGTHAFVEAVLAIVRENKFTIGQIERIDVRISPFFSVLCEPPGQKRRPKTAIDAKFSVPFTIAIALAQGGITLDSFALTNLENSRLHALADRIFHEVETTWPFEQSTRGVLTVALADGRTLSREVIKPLGHPHNPMDREAMTWKFVDCLASARQPVDADAAEAVVAHLASIGQLADMRDVFGGAHHAS
ncbi:MmgE/PrpD family protein [Pseudorhodoplanes sinuspersici]|nr:MmgE/PrpD family protein [Pseudorhodoplanes sinuspersici]RKE70601.1 2-methylcitrate dehydratase PrpD [Pseudorhodoplanes sinuspersici]